MDSVPELRLYKFGERRHICNLVHKGELYLRPASSYADKTLSRGAHDPKELMLEQSLPANASYEVFGRRNGASKGRLRPVAVGPLTAEVLTNYYVFCLSYRYGIELYEVFRSDSCLVIADADRFINQAGKAIANQLPGWAVDAGTVCYRSRHDFHSLYPSNQDVFYGKDESYANQFEVRIVCTPPNPIRELEPVIVPIGNLYGYTFLTGLRDPNKMIETEYSECLGSPFKCGEES